MFFKLELNLNLEMIQLAEDEEFRFELSDEYTTVVILRRPTAEEQKVGHQRESLFCTAVAELTPDLSISEAFEALAKNRLPAGYKKPKREQQSSYDYVDDEGNIKDKYIAGLELMPDDFQTFQSNIRNKLSDYIRRTAQILRWRNDIVGNHNPVQASRGLFWSFDGETWHPMPSDGYVRVSTQGFSKISEQRQIEVSQMVVAGLDEPLGHTLFRESWEQKDRNPRSALILGIVAIEVGFKQCVGILVPHAQWLMENLPSPPITKMLASYLSELPTKLDFDGKVLPPPKHIIKALQSGIEQRNKTTHVGSPAPRYDELEELLLCVRDSLYLLDYYCGVEWALEHLQEKTLDALREQAKVS